MQLNFLKFQVLVNDRLQGQQLLTETIQAGERLYQDTAAPGREIIRQKLRELRDKFDVFSNDVLEVQKQLDSLNQHWISFKETFKQVSIDLFLNIKCLRKSYEYYWFAFLILLIKYCVLCNQETHKLRNMWNFKILNLLYWKNDNLFNHHK